MNIFQMGCNDANNDRLIWGSSFAGHQLMPRTSTLSMLPSVSNSRNAREGNSGGILTAHNFHSTNKDRTTPG